MIATFAFIEVMGFTFNNMTMLALSLSIGILVDDAIVVIENIHRHLEMGKPAFRAAADATSEIGLAVLATTFSIVAVFVPVAVMKGIVGRFFYQFGLTVSFEVLVSLLVSFTLTPMLSSRLLRRATDHRPNAASAALERILDSVDRSYRWLLGVALSHRVSTLGIAALALVGSFVLVGMVKSEFSPLEDRAQFQVRVELPTGTSLETTTTFVEALGADIRKNGPHVTGVFVAIGGGAQGQVNVAEIQVLLSPAKSRAAHQVDLMAWFRERYSGLGDAAIAINPISPMGNDGGFRQQPIQFNIRGKDMDEHVAVSKALLGELGTIPGFVDLDITFRGGKPELVFDVDRDRAAELGVPIAAIATTLRARRRRQSHEMKDGLLSTSRCAYPQAKATRTSRELARAVGDGPIDSDLERGPRRRGEDCQTKAVAQRQITVLAGLKTLPLGEAKKLVDQAAGKIVPSHLTADYAGMADIMTESFGYMGIALMLAVVIVYMILAAQFDSFVHPLTIMLSLPLSVVGAFGGLFVSGMTLNIFSMIGVIMLMGLVTKNAILLVDFANQVRARGKTAVEALLEAGPIRLRPILMTTFAMIFGMFPVALALGEGGEVRAPMAVTVIGGLITSTFLTLVVVPVVYVLVDRFTTSGPIRWLGAKLFGVAAADANGSLANLG